MNFGSLVFLTSPLQRFCSFPILFSWILAKGNLRVANLENIFPFFIFSKMIYHLISTLQNFVLRNYFCSHAFVVKIHNHLTKISGRRYNTVRGIPTKRSSASKYISFSYLSHFFLSTQYFKRKPLLLSYSCRFCGKSIS